MIVDTDRSDILEHAFFSSRWDLIAEHLETGRRPPRRDILLDLFEALNSGSPVETTVVERVITAFLDRGFPVSIDAFVAACEPLKNADGVMSRLAMQLVSADVRHPITGIRPLVLASQYRLYRTVEVLLSRLADPNGYDGWGRTPLLAAVFEHGIGVRFDDRLRRTIRVLLQFGADPYKPLLQSHNDVPCGMTVDVVGVNHAI